MSLLITESDTFVVNVKYSQQENGELKFDEGTEAAAFTFKRPSWVEMRMIMSNAVIVNANSGQAIIDPYKLMDTKIKLLLKDWDLKNDKGKIPVTPDSIDNLHPTLVQYLFDKLNNETSPVTAAIASESSPIKE